MDHHHARDAENIGCFVLIVSDTRDPETDKTGNWLKAELQKNSHRICGYEIVEDEPRRICARLRKVAERADVNIILVSGGTGIAQRDTTIEAIRPMFSKELPGFGEIFRLLSFNEIGPNALLSRATAGIFEGKFVVVLPGSIHAVQLATEKILTPTLPHIAGLLNKEL